MPVFAIFLLFSVGEQFKYCFDNWSAVRVRNKGKSFFMLQLFTQITVWRFVSNKFSFFYRSNSAALKTPVDCFIFAAAHKKSEFKVFFIVFIVWIISLERCDNFCTAEFKSLRYNALIDCISACETFYLHYQHAIPHTLFYFVQ